MRFVIKLLISFIAQVRYYLCYLWIRCNLDNSKGKVRRDRNKNSPAIIQQQAVLLNKKFGHVVSWFVDNRLAM